MAAPMIIGGAIGAGVGLLKYLQGKEQEKRDREMMATMMEQSPWTGVQVNPSSLKKADLMGNVGQGLLTGMGMGQAYTKTSRDINRIEVPVGTQGAFYDSDTQKWYIPSVQQPQQQSAWHPPMVPPK